MKSEIQTKIERLSNALDNYIEGEQLPISINDIYFLIGAATRLEKEIEKIKEAYKRDFLALNTKLEKSENNYKTLADVKNRLDERALKYRQVVNQVKKMPRFLLSKSVKLELESMENK